jgi:SAM-dependent methyltransferase
VLSDVHCLPFPDASFDLVISRGSLLFWEDKPATFREVKRVLRNKGRSYMGCGMGSAALRNEIIPKMRARDTNWDENARRREAKLDSDELQAALDQAGLIDATILRNDSGMWVVF